MWDIFVVKWYVRQHFQFLTGGTQRRMSNLRGKNCTLSMIMGLINFITIGVYTGIRVITQSFFKFSHMGRGPEGLSYVLQQWYFAGLFLY